MIMKFHLMHQKISLTERIKLMYVGEIEIKKNEVIFSVIIFSVLMIVGFLISNAIHQSLLEKYLIYDTAVKIEGDEKTFRHCMETNSGHAFVYGKLDTVDPVSFPTIDGQYAYIVKKSQKYTKHGDEDDEYWTWDTVRIEDKCATRITFLNVEFAYNQIPFPAESEICKIKTGHNRRDVYYGVDTSYNGTLFAYLANNTISDTSFFANTSIEKSIASLESGWQLVLFWILWSFFIIGAIIGFVALENKWIDNQK